MMQFFFLSGLILWAISALIVLVATIYLLWEVIEATAKAFSIMCFLHALHSKRRWKAPWLRWSNYRSAFIAAWDDDGTLNIIADDDSRWSGIWNWTISDNPWPDSEGNAKPD